jgi:hypothetical protein
MWLSDCQLLLALYFIFVHCAVCCYDELLRCCRATVTTHDGSAFVATNFFREEGESQKSSITKQLTLTEFLKSCTYSKQASDRYIVVHHRLSSAIERNSINYYKKNLWKRKRMRVTFAFDGCRDWNEWLDGCPTIKVGIQQHTLHANVINTGICFILTYYIINTGICFNLT